MARRAALVVASDRFEDAAFDPLRAPAHDIDALTRVLADPAIGDFEVQALMNQPAHEIALEIEGFFSDRNPDDLLLLYISCHGVKDAAGRLYFVMTNTRLQRLGATGLSSVFVSEQAERSRAKRIVLMLDCCYSGAFARNTVARAGGSVDVTERFQGRGRVVITASSAMEYAYEGDELVADEPQPSVFTRAVVDGLETGEADRDGDGRITVDELYDHVVDVVRDSTPDQHPNKMSTVEGTVYLARNPRPVRPRPDVVMGLERVSARRLRLVLSNQGTAPVELALTAQVSPHGPPATIEPAGLRLGAGDRATADVRLNLRAPVLGPARQYAITVYGHAGGRGWSTESQLVIRPRLRMPIVAALAATALVIAAGAVFAALRNGRVDAFPIAHSGRVDAPGAADEYAFRARAKQVVFFDVQSVQREGPTPGDIAWTLLAPNGDPVFENESLYGHGDIGPQTLTTPGEYRLRVFGRGDDIGDYAFKLRPSG